MNKDNPPDVPGTEFIPACMRHGLGYAEHDLPVRLQILGMPHDPGPRAAMPANRRGWNSHLDWADVRLWRKAKRQVLIERRLSLSVPIAPCTGTR